MKRNSLLILANGSSLKIQFFCQSLSLSLSPSQLAIPAMEPHEIKGLHCQPNANLDENLLSLPPSHRPYPSMTNLNMQPIESTDHTISHANLSQNPESSSNLFNRILSNSLMHVPLHIFSPNTSSLSTADTILNEPRDQQLGIANEKRLRRMISNRESARRSRMRRKRQIEELQNRVNELQTMNHQLSDKVIHLLESNHQILQENSQLKEKVSSLQIVLSNLLSPLRNLEENSYNTDRLKDETANRSIHH